MNYFNLIYTIIGFAVLSFFFEFYRTAITEKNAQAKFRIILIMIIFISLWIVPTFFIKTIYYQIGTISFLVVFLFSFFAPIGKKKKIAINAKFGEAEKVDERDTMFARSYLKEESEIYENYYSQHPEKKLLDDKIRAMPKLLEPGGKYYEELKANYIRTLFDIEESRISEVTGNVNPNKIEIGIEEATKLIKEITLYLGANEVGICLLNPNYIYSHSAIGNSKWGNEIVNKHKFAVAYTLEMNFEEVQEAPKLEITEETANRYLDAQKISIAIAKFIRDLGYDARAHISGSDYQVMLPPIAYDAGLGELGRLNFLISKKFGARIRLGCITTDLELIPDKPIEFGVQNFCERCLKCADFCPSKAISREGKINIRDVEKWDFKIEQCYQIWRFYGTDCGICMKVCPFSHPDNFVHNTVRYGIKTSAFAREISLRGDDFIYGKHKRQ